MSIADIFSRLGEQKFRDIERQVVSEVASKDGQVIATGGGVPLLDENVQALKRNGILICLTASPEIVYRRTLRSDTRPLLRTQDKMEQIKTLLESRQFYYAVADQQVDTSSRPASAVAREIVDLYQTHGNN
jgi:shikimate kinase